MKKMFCTILVFILIVSAFSFSASAASTANFLIDNDTVDSTCKTERDGFGIYVTGSSHYNGDCRRQSSSNKYTWYQWCKKSEAIYSSYYPIYMVAGVYLNNSMFTDTQAHYYVVQRDGGYLMNILNQNTAPAGWTYFDYIISVNYATPNGFSLYGMYVSPSGTGTGYTGADAIRITAEAG